MDSSKSDEETSCNSCKRQENGDASSASGRPLKKARFSWQVKGRYHLKNEISENRTTSNTHDSNYTCSSSENENSNDLTGNTEQNLEILGDYLLKQDFNTLDSITEPESLPSTSIATENLPYPIYITSALNESMTDHIESNEDPNAIVDTSNFYVEDQLIARWQARQMAKCYVDNTINTVLDSWMSSPLPTEIDNNRFLALDVAEFINNLPGDNNSIENEGILMAISAHGLQNTSSSSSCSLDHVTSSSNRDLYPLSPVSSLRSEEDALEPECSNMSWLNAANTKEANEDPPLTYYPYVSNASYQCNPENTSNESDISFNDNETISNHYDFLDAAVTFAIQYKGLTSLGTE